MKFFSKYVVMIVLLVGLSFSSCKKQDDFLNAKQNLNQVVPTTLKDFQAILDNANIFNLNLPTSGDAGADNIVVSNVFLAAVPAKPRNIYLWAKDIYQGATSTDWIFGYQAVEYSNIVLDGLSRMGVPSDSNGLAQYNSVKGSALFFRTYAFYLLSGEFCKPFTSQSSTDPGIVLRLSSDPGAKVVRSTVQQTYAQMISDMQAAIPLLPVTSSYQTRPSRPAAYALLAKIYLAMSDYKNARDAASNSLDEFNTLLDFNSSLVNPGAGAAAFPTYPNNPEVCFYASGGGDALYFIWCGLPFADVDSAFYNSYDANDLRKTCFYSARATGSHYFSGNYLGTNASNFAGIATNEVLLIRAECSARLGNVQDALIDLNALLVKRYVTGKYIAITTNDQTSLLNKILLERRKELPFTGQLRWEDLRRLNQDHNYAVTLTRSYQGQTYTLPPNDPRYVLPIPDQEIQLTGIKQNSR